MPTTGLTLAIFSLSQLRLQLEADGGNADAARVLELRKNANPVLATVIWGNVSTNVLLTLLSDSVLTGLSAFFFSAIVITLFCEIIPQAYFSRNALRMTARFLPFLNFYRVVLFPIAKPTAMLLVRSLGVTAIELLPVHTFVNDNYLLDKGLTNFWGYNSISFFSPMRCYSYVSDFAFSEFKEMVARFHDSGIEVILDVVYNHTAEGNQLGPTLSFKGIDNAFPTKTKTWKTRCPSNSVTRMK